MQIPGEWHLCDDGIERPVIHGEVLARGGSWVMAPFLVDTGADRTVLCADTLAALDLKVSAASERLGGLGGLVRPVIVDTAIHLPLE
jgi:hypothetical protein